MDELGTKSHILGNQSSHINQILPTDKHVSSNSVHEYLPDVQRSFRNFDKP